MQQGVPIGPLLFSLALRDALHELHKQLSHKFDMSTDVALLTFYVDDGIVVDRQDILQEVLAVFNSSKANTYGLHLPPSNAAYGGQLQKRPSSWRPTPTW